MNHNIVMKMFAALGQDSRLSIYQRVVQAGEAGLSAGKIGEHLAIAQTTLSFHLKELVHSLSRWQIHPRCLSQFFNTGYAHLIQCAKMRP